MSTGEANMTVVRVAGDTISGVWSGDPRAAYALMHLLPGSAIATGQLRGPVGEGPPRESDTFGKFTALCDASGRAAAFSPAVDWDKELLRDVRRFTAVRVTAADEEAKMLFGEWRGLQHEVRMAVAAMLLVSVKQVTLRDVHGAPAGPDDLDGLWTVACPTAMWRRLREILVPPQVTTPRGPADDDLLLAGPNAPNYSAFILRDNGAWEQPDFRISTPKDATVSRDVVVRMLKTHYRGFAVYGLAESEDCPPGSETAILVPPQASITRGPTDEDQGEPTETVKAEQQPQKGEDATTSTSTTTSDGTLIPPPASQPLATFRTDETFEPTHRDAEITVTMFNDGVLIGAWSGNKDGVVDLVQHIEGLEEEDPLLIAPDGTFGDDKTTHGIWMVHAPFDRLDDLQERFERQPVYVEVRVTKLKDFAVWGTWRGNQHGVVDRIRTIEGLERSNPTLFAMDGRVARDNVSEGEWMAQASQGSWGKLQERFGKEVQ